MLHLLSKCIEKSYLNIEALISKKEYKRVQSKIFKIELKLIYYFYELKKD